MMYTLCLNTRLESLSSHILWLEHLKFAILMWLSALI